MKVTFICPHHHRFKRFRFLPLWFYWLLWSAGRALFLILVLLSVIEWSRFSLSQNHSECKMYMAMFSAFACWPLFKSDYLSSFWIWISAYSWCLKVRLPLTARFTISSLKHLPSFGIKKLPGSTKHMQWNSYFHGWPCFICICRNFAFRQKMHRWRNHATTKITKPPPLFTVANCLTTQLSVWKLCSKAFLINFEHRRTTSHHWSGT